MATYYNPKIVTNNIEFSVDAANPKSWSGAIPGGPAYGYMAAGRPTPVQTTVDRIDYSSDTPAMSPKGPLSAGRYSYGAIANSSYGYWGGGSYPNVSTVDRLDFSSDTTTCAVKGSLSQVFSMHSAVGNASYGYFTGGWPSKSSVDRIDYSNDTATAAAKGPLSYGRYDHGATGNDSYGYIVGGYPHYTTIDRIEYSNDTTTASPTGTLTIARQHNSATGNSSYGWVAGGAYPGPSFHTSVDRIDYSNDTATAAAKGPIIDARGYMGATGSNFYGYFSGGTPGTVSRTDRIDYSNDTPTTSTKGPLSSARFAVGGLSPRANGLPKPESIWKDITGKGHDIDILSATNQPTFSGLNGGVWDFDGTNDYISLDATTDIQAQAVDWTWECWFYVDAGASSYDYLFAYGPPHQIAWYDNQLNAWFNDTDNTSSYDVAFASGSNTVPTGQWTHGVISRIGSAWKMYINGVEKASATASFTVANSSTAPKIGSYDGSQYFLDGKIASMRIYKGRGFTASEVLNNFNATRTRFGV